jgi:hypothetical protein
VEEDSSNIFSIVGLRALQMDSVSSKQFNNHRMELKTKIGLEMKNNNNSLVY